MSVDVNIVNPFITATLETVEIMGKLKAVRTGLHIKEKKEFCFGDISGVIGFAGDLSGNLAISFPAEVAQTIINKMTGEIYELENPMIADGIGEIANMVAGGAKGILSSSYGYTYNISLPSIITGKSHYVSHPSDMVVMVVEFTIPDTGIFNLEICVKKEL